MSSDEQLLIEDRIANRDRKHAHNLSIISTALKHPNSTPEITKIVLDQFNLLNVPLQMEYLKAGLIDGFYDNPNLGENSFTKLDLYCGFTPEYYYAVNLPTDLTIQNSLKQLYNHTKNLPNSGDFNDLIVKIVTESKFPKVLQTVFLNIAFNERGPIGGEKFINLQIRQHVKENEKANSNNLPDHYLFKIATNKNTSPEVLSLIFKVLEKNKFYYTETESKSEPIYIKLLQKISFENPNLAIDLRLNIIDARTGQKYFTISETGDSFDVDTFLKNLLKAPENRNPQDYAKRVEFELNNEVLDSDEYANYRKIIVDSLKIIGENKLVLSPEIFKKLNEIEEQVYQLEKARYISENPDKRQYMTPPNSPERYKFMNEFMNRKLEFFYNLFSRSELEEIYKANSNVIQDWVRKNYNGVKEFNVTIENLLAIAKSKFTPIEALPEKLGNQSPLYIYSKAL